MLKLINHEKKKKLTITIMMVLMACSSFDEAFVSNADMEVNDSPEQVAWQITDDVNSVEVANIVKQVFGRERMSRSNGYSISLMKGELGEDAIICLNLENEGGFLLLSAVKTYSPILAYSKSGHFDVDIEKPDGLSEWINMTEKDIEISRSLPEDSVQSVRNEWRIFEENKFDMESRSDDFNLLSDGSSNLSWEELYALTSIMMSKMSEWNRVTFLKPKMRSNSIWCV